MEYHAAVLDDSRLKGLTIRAALLLGFGLTLALWLFAGYQFTQRIALVQNEADEINARYMHAQELLSTVRSRVLLESVYVRDALLDPDRGAADQYRRQLAATYHSIEAALGEYTPVADSAAALDRLAGLRHELQRYHAAMLDIVGGNQAEGPGGARAVLSARVVPRREMVIRVSEDVQALNRDAYIQQQRDIAAIYQTAQRRIWQQLGGGLLVSFAIGLIATRYAGGLEKRIREQMAVHAEAARDLQRLSSQIINAQEDERRVIARELHDEIGQVLTAIKLELAMAENAIGAGVATRDTLTPARAIADSALQSVRDLSRLLHPPVLDELGLPAAVEWHLKEFGRRHGLAVALTHDGMAERLPADAEMAAYRIVQEAVTNVVKHARATMCLVHLQRLPQTLLVTIEDDGVGLPAAVADATSRGLGLLGIRERAAHLRGAVRIESASGRGTRLTVTLAADRPAAKGAA